MFLYIMPDCKALLIGGEGGEFNYSRQLQRRLQTTEFCRLNVEPLVNTCSLTRFWKACALYVEAQPPEKRDECSPIPKRQP